MRPQGDGAYECPNGHRWLDDSPELHALYAIPLDRSQPTALSLAYVPNSVHGGGGSSNCGKSPGRQKADAWLKRHMKGIHARQA